MQKNKLKILITNDDSYTSKGIKLIAGILSQYGNVTVVAPESPQSGKATALTLDRILRVRKCSTLQTEYNTQIEEYHLTGTPADCVKWAMNFVYAPQTPDLLVSGINHGSNASAASVYSGTLGATAEGTLYEVPSIGLSINTHVPDPDFSGIRTFLPDILERFFEHRPSPGVYLNINFPHLPAQEIKGIRMASQGRGRWVREFEKRVDPHGGEYYWMTGNFLDLEKGSTGDHRLLEEGYITIVPHKTDTTDYQEMKKLREAWNL